jgi:hypothetical protein
VCLIRINHIRNNHQLKQLVFDREPDIVPAEDESLKCGIELKLKATGQKAGLAEVSIKAGVRAKFGYLPPNQFNMDLCMDSIAVLN